MTIQLRFPNPDEAPPILGSWRNLYVIALVWLALLILIFWMFTRYFS